MTKRARDTEEDIKCVFVNRITGHKCQNSMDKVYLLYEETMGYCEKHAKSILICLSYVRRLEIRSSVKLIKNTEQENAIEKRRMKLIEDTLKTQKDKMPSVSSP